MKFKPLDTVVLDRDLPDDDLRKGDLGAVVHTHDPDGLEVKFVRVSGRTHSLVTLQLDDVRTVEQEDLLAVRTLARGAPQSPPNPARGRSAIFERAGIDRAVCLATFERTGRQSKTMFQSPDTLATADFVAGPTSTTMASS